MRRLVIAVGISSGPPISIGLSQLRETSWRSPLKEKQIIPPRVHLRAAKACRGVYVVFIYLFIRSFIYFISGLFAHHAICRQSGPPNGAPTLWIRLGFDFVCLAAPAKGPWYRAQQRDNQCALRAGNRNRNTAVSSRGKLNTSANKRQSYSYQCLLPQYCK